MSDEQTNDLDLHLVEVDIHLSGRQIAAADRAALAQVQDLLDDVRYFHGQLEMIKANPDGPDVTIRGVVPAVLADTLHAIADGRSIDDVFTQHGWAPR